MPIERGRQETGLGHQGVRPYLWSVVKRPEFLSGFCHCGALGGHFPSLGPWKREAGGRKQRSVAGCKPTR